MCVKTKYIKINYFLQLLYLYAMFVSVSPDEFCQFSLACVRRTRQMMSEIADQRVEDRPKRGVNVEIEDFTLGTPHGQGLNSSSCCPECKCARNCEKNVESCCFPELTPKYVDDSIETCTYVQVPIPDIEWRYKILAYNMVDRNPRDGCVDKVFSAQYPGQECGDVTAADWGSLYPVSSVSEGKIYRNIHCAVCHGVTDGELWQVSKVCLPNNFGIFSNTDIAEAITLGQCKIHFDYAGIMSDVNERRCFDGEMINYCPTTNFSIPEGIDLNKKTVANYCSSGFVSPYVHNYVYANVFCLICNEDFENFQEIRPYCIGGADYVTSRTFSAILVPLTRDIRKKESRKLACVEKHHSMKRRKCRPVICQSGTSLIGEECQYILDVLYGSEFLFIVNVVLLPVFDLPVSEIPQDSYIAPYASQIPSRLHSAWREGWNVHTVAVSVTVSDSLPSNTSIESFSVQLAYYVSDKNVITTADFLSDLQNNLNDVTHWTFDTSNGSVSLEQVNTLGSEPILRADIEKILHTFNETKTDEISIKSKLDASKTYKTVALPSTSGPKNPWNTNEAFIYVMYETKISRMFYCKQIELYHDEFVMFGDKVVYIKHLDVLMYSGQFISVPDKDGLGTKVRICLNDSGFKMTSSGVRLDAKASLKTLGVLVWYGFVLCFLAKT